MANYLGVNISGIIAQTIGPLIPTASLLKITYGDRVDPSNPTSPNEQSYQVFSGRGFFSEFEDSTFNGTTVERKDRLVVLLIDSFVGLPEPSIGDQITIEGTTYRLVNPVMRDPSSVHYICHVRG